MPPVWFAGADGISCPGTARVRGAGENGIEIPFYDAKTTFVV